MCGFDVCERSQMTNDNEVIAVGNESVKPCAGPVKIVVFMGVGRNGAALLAGRGGAR